MSNLPPLNKNTIWAILSDEIDDATVNKLIWYYLEYEGQTETWNNNKVDIGWRDKYPNPPDFLESCPATVKLTRYIPLENKQLLKEELGC
jgi:hypothetical protein